LVKKYIVSEITNISPNNEMETTHTSIEFNQLTPSTNYMFTVAAKASDGRTGTATAPISGLTGMLKLL